MTTDNGTQFTSTRFIETLNRLGLPMRSNAQTSSDKRNGVASGGTRVFMWSFYGRSQGVVNYRASLGFCPLLMNSSLLSFSGFHISPRRFSSRIE